MIYLASPYWHDDPAIRYRRANQADRAAADLMRQGYLVFAPVPYGHRYATRYGLTNETQWRDWGLEMLRACDRILVLRLMGWRKSTGIGRELDVARNCGLPVLHGSLVPASCKDTWTVEVDGDLGQARYFADGVLATEARR